MNASERSEDYPADAPQPSAPQPSAPQPTSPAPPPHAGPPPAQQPAPAGYYRAPDPAPESRRKSPALACILSAVPGLGQVYVGYYGLGFVHIIVVSLIFTIFAAEPSEELIAPVVVFFIFFMLYNIVDAGRRAALYNLAVAGVPGVEMPETMKLPKFGGSIFGGIAIVLGSFILLLYTRFGVSLEWLEEWWPVAPMIFGAYLVTRALQERAAKE